MNHAISRVCAYLDRHHLGVAPVEKVGLPPEHSTVRASPYLPLDAPRIGDERFEERMDERRVRRRPPSPPFAPSAAPAAGYTAAGVGTAATRLAAVGRGGGGRGMRLAPLFASRGASWGARFAFRLDVVLRVQELPSDGGR